MTSKVKGEGEGRINGQNYIFGYTFGSVCHLHFQLISCCSLSKGQEINIQGQRCRSRTHQVKRTLLSLTLVLFVVRTSTLSHIVAHGKAKKFLTSKIKGEGQGHIKGKIYIFGHNFGSICHPHFQLVSYCSLCKGQKILGIQC